MERLRIRWLAGHQLTFGGSEEPVYLYYCVTRQELVEMLGSPERARELQERGRSGDWELLTKGPT